RTSALPLLLLHLLPFLLGPPRTDLFPTLIVHERPRRHVVSNGGGGCDVNVIPEGHRRDQGGVAADLHPVSDRRRVFREAIVVAGDRSGADVCISTYRHVPEVGQVVRLAA